MKFKIGQQVTPTKRNFDVVFGKMEASDLPVFGKVYTVAGYPIHGQPAFPKDFWGMMALEEMKPNKIYHERWFEALVSDEKLEADIKELDYV